MICPRCGNNEWQMLIHVAEGVAFCSKCGNFGPIEEFQQIDRVPKGIYDRRDNQNNPSNNSSSSSMVGVHSHIQADIEDARISRLPSWLI